MSPHFKNSLSSLGGEKIQTSNSQFTKINEKEEKLHKIELNTDELMVWTRRVHNGVAAR